MSMHACTRCRTAYEPVGANHVHDGLCPQCSRLEPAPSCKQCHLSRTRPEALAAVAATLKHRARAPELCSDEPMTKVLAVGALAGTAQALAEMVEAEAQGICTFCHRKASAAQEAA